MNLLQIRNLRKEYPQPGSPALALCLDALEARGGEALAVTGPSGSGKTTLLRLLAALTPPTRGEILFAGLDLSALGEKAAAWRASSVGYVFQEMNLLPDFTLEENLLLAAEISHLPRRAAEERVSALTRRLTLEDRLRHRPAALSLGEKQRAAVARAVLHRPPLLLADEPTASLDGENAGRVLNLLRELCAESGALLIVTTHDEGVKKLFPRQLELRRAEGGAP
jgi:putative ABC transport system ATP-binding protein